MDNLKHDGLCMLNGERLEEIDPHVRCNLSTYKLKVAMPLSDVLLCFRTLLKYIVTSFDLNALHA